MLTVLIVTLAVGGILALAAIAVIVRAAVAIRRSETERSAIAARAVHVRPATRVLRR